MLLSASELLQVRQDLTLLEALEPLIAEVKTQLGQLRTGEQWHKQLPLLLQLPGLEMLSAMTILAAIGEIARFPSAKHLVDYAGLGARIHASGLIQRGGGTTKEGCGELRTIMVEAAWVAVERHPHWKAYFEQLSSRIGKQKAIIAIARKLLVAVWHVLTREQTDVHADAQAIARKLLKRIECCGSTPGKRRSAGKLLRRYLDQLDLAEQVGQGQYGGRVYQVALREETST